MSYEFKVDNPMKHGLTYKVLKSFRFYNQRWTPGQFITMRSYSAQIFIERGYLTPASSPRYVDVLKRKLTLPERIIVLGSGPKGRGGYDKIQAEDFVIALNGAIDCPVPITIWAAQDPTLYRQEYFINAMRRLYDKHLDLSMESIGKGYVVPVMEQTMVANHFPWIVCTFQLQRRPLMTVQDVAIRKSGRLRVGCTVAGAVIQLAYLCGTRKITLCGIDMFGAVYWDNSSHRHQDRKEKMWGNAPVFNALIRYYEGLGMEFNTLSETALEVKPYV